MIILHTSGLCVRNSTLGNHAIVLDVEPIDKSRARATLVNARRSNRFRAGRSEGRNDKPLLFVLLPTPQPKHNNKMQRATFRSAEDLYTQLPVRDVVRVLAKTKQDAEKKREELRDLVGQRYHDLIDSADGIISMNSTVTEFEKTLLTIDHSATLLLQQDLTKHHHQTETTVVVVGGGEEQEAAARVKGGDGEQEELINLLLRAPSEIWAALDSANELRACKLYLAALDAIQRLGLFANGEETKEDGVIADDMYASLVQAAQRDQASFGRDWQIQFPFLLSQAQLVSSECEADIVDTCHAAFAERQISPARVERAMEALLLLKQVTNPTETLLQARSKLLQELVAEPTGGEEMLVSLAELLGRTVGDCKLLSRLTKEEDNHLQVAHWMTSFAQPLALQQTVQCNAKLATLPQLIQLETLVKEATGEEGLFAQVFALAFQNRANELLAKTQEATLKRVKRMLLNGNKPQQALHVLQTSTCDGKTSDWANDLLAWLETKPVQSVGRFCALLAESNLVAPSVKPRLVAMATQAQSAWVTEVVDRHGQVFAVQCQLLPWQQRRNQGGFSSTMGGWQRDDTINGELPAFPSWPCSEFCFQLAVELDGFMGLELAMATMEDEGEEPQVKRILGEAAWKYLHSVYSALAKTATGSDGKLQAAFDLEYSSIALLGLERPLLPFTNGGVDVYACSGVLKTRAKACFASSHRLAMAGTKPPTNTAMPLDVHLQTLVPPVPRFALLPVPQRTGNKLASPRSVATTQPLAPSPKQLQQPERQNTLGRVLGWLS
ncbi:hypothetical protein BASA81_003817 [Batrachochytrium salamandrivorans]|nr:hypothetical protein BASA81_003817 [Batrachochytrium salamandrivorans]